MSPEPRHGRRKTQPGDVLVVAGHHVGEPERVGEILELLGAPGYRRYRVRWEDGHESILRPSSDAVIRLRTPTRRKRARR